MSGKAGDQGKDHHGHPLLEERKEGQNMDDDQELQEGAEEALESVEQETIMFYGKPIVTVTLADGRRGIVLRWMCEGLEVDTQAQVRRLRRSPTTHEDVWPVRVDTESARQTMPT